MAKEISEDRNAMSFSELLSWAWRETPPVHKNAANLMIHLFAVPLFVLGHFLLIVGVIFNLWFILAGIFSIVISLLLQSFGHSLEANRVPPFAGLGDFLRRLYVEQFCNFWRFMFSGQWFKSLKTRNGSVK